MNFPDYHSKDAQLSGAKVLVTGGAGFIGSHLVDYLAEKKVNRLVILDNFSSGNKQNLSYAQSLMPIEILEGDLQDDKLCEKATENIDIVFHQAAYNSVPRSINEPLNTLNINIIGTSQLLRSAAANGVKKFVYASSSSVYGTNKRLPKVEDQVGECMSPYALSKATGEQLAKLFGQLYGMSTVGLRYFNVFGPRQNPDGDYAAFIPRLIRSFLTDVPLEIFGDGEQSRDFTHVNNVVQANIKAAFGGTITDHEVFNIALGHTISLNQLIEMVRKHTQKAGNVQYGAIRKGDIRDSMADIQKAQKILGFEPETDFESSFLSTFAWFEKNLNTIKQ